MIPDSGMSFAMIGGGSACDSVGDRETGLAVVNPRQSFSAALVLMVPNVMTWATVAAPLLGRIAHHLAAATVVEVDVDIGCRRALRVEEAFKQQPVRYRIDVGDPERISDQRPGRRPAPRAHPDVNRTRVVDQVCHDQEVRRKTLPQMTSIS